MERSLSVLLPVHNAQASLEDKVIEVLDILPDLTGRFDILIIDDGSTDATAEVAHELSKKYPQVRSVRHAQPMGLAQSLHTGLGRTQGEIVVVHDRPQVLQAGDIARLWRHRQDQDFAAAMRLDRTEAERPWWISKLLPWRSAAAGSGFHMLRRHAIPGHIPAGDRRADLPAVAAHRPATPNFLAKVKRFALGE